jgi:hypothetical protein
MNGLLLLGKGGAILPRRCFCSSQVPRDPVWVNLLETELTQARMGLFQSMVNYKF